MKKILFITQNLGRTGSEMLLWYSLLHLDKDKFEASLFVKERGALIDQLPAHIKYFVAYKKSGDKLLKIFRGLLKMLKIDPLVYQLSRIQKKTKAEFWYLNTIANPEIYPIAKKMGIQVITHFHELPMAYNFVSYRDMQAIITDSKTIIGCSEAVCSKVINMGHTNVRLLHGFINPEKIIVNKQTAEMRQKAGFKPGDFVWAISGKTTLIKGIDFLIPLLEKLPPQVKILWIGDEEPGGAYFYVQKTIEKKFNGRVFFSGAQVDDYYNYLNSCDAFLLLSREDSFPLVMLEAAALGKPIAGFNSGGIKEFVTADKGIVVDSWSFSDLALAMEFMQNHREQFDIDKIRASVSDYEVATQLPKWTHILSEISDKNI